LSDYIHRAFTYVLSERSLGQGTTMNGANIHSLAVMFLSAAIVSYPNHRVQADTPTGAQKRGCSHLRFSAVPVAARDGAPLFASDLNSKGEVVGDVFDQDPFLTQAFLWKDGSYVRLGDRIFAGALNTHAVAINDRTQVIGDFLTPDRIFEQYLLDKRGVTYLVGDFADPQEINDHGEIVGVVRSDISIQGAVWSNGETLPLPMAPGHFLANAFDINNKGTVVGLGETLEGHIDALAWFAPYTTAPTVIPLPANLRISPGVLGVNDRDEVIFSVGLESGGGRGAVWSPGRPVQILDPLTGHEHSSAEDINRASLIVGISVTALSSTATVWRGGQTCALQDLVKTPELEGRWTVARRVNERGEVLALLEPSPVGAGWFVLRPIHGHQ
jgi:uncharacterized membrane protein